MWGPAQKTRLPSLAVLVAALFLAASASGQSVLEFACPATCEAHHACLPELDSGKCPAGSRWDPKGGPCGCCGACVRYLGDGELCYLKEEPERRALDDGTILVRACDPVLYDCKKDSSKWVCSPKKGGASATGPCIERAAAVKVQENAAIEGGFTTDYFLYPTCDDDGFFSPVQERVNDYVLSRYFCVDRLGNRIFGDVYADVDDSDKINCACSGMISELLQADKDMHVTLTCDTTGNFRELQCQDDLCFCVNATTGIITGPFVPKPSMDQLPCYDKKLFPQGYFGGDWTCGTYKDRFAQIKKLYASHGTDVQGLAFPNCGFDHTYNPKYCTTEKCTCVEPDGTFTRYASTSDNTNSAEIDCNCARDQYKLQQAGIFSNTLDCEGYGDYKPIQEADASISCANSDGMRCSSVYTDPSLKCCLPCNTRASCRPDTLPLCTDSMSYVDFCKVSQLSP